MRPGLWCLFNVAIAFKVVLAFPQVAFKATDSPWDTQVAWNATGNLIFQSISSLLQHWPNTKHANGHTIASASIAPGTLLYHGWDTGRLALDRPEWAATDPEHAYLFCIAECHMLTFITTRKLRLAYFDGSSAAKMESGTMDSQDIVFWGEVRPDEVRNELVRILDACKWGKQFGLDGFVRMEMDFEIMMCDFLSGLQLVSNSTLVPTTIPTVHFPHNARRSIKDIPGILDLEYDLQGEASGRVPSLPLPYTPFPKVVIPEGWKGSLRSADSADIEVISAGSWHNHAPGETRVKVDYSSIVSFFDPGLTSLVESRRNQTRQQYRILGISPQDVADVRAQLVDIFSRDVEGSGIDWQSIVRVVVDRYSARLELVRLLLEPSETRNITQQAAEVRNQILIMLTPYMLTDAFRPDSTDPSQDTAWISPIVNQCAFTLTSWAPIDKFTRQEKVVKNAIDEVLHEICRIIGRIWVDAFDVEAASPDQTRILLAKWTDEIKGLMDWLDWSTWDTCKPGCGPEEMCYITTWPWLRTIPVDLTPRCISRVRPYNFN